MNSAPDHPSVDLVGLAAACREKYFTAAPELEAVVSTNPIHIGYLSGYRSILHDVQPYAQAIVATRDRIALVTGASDGAAALEVIGDPSAIWRYGLFFVGSTAGKAGYENMPAASGSFAEALTKAIAGFGLSGKRVGLDIADRAVADMLREQIAGAIFTSAASGFRASRATKLPNELALLRHASQITDTAIRNIFPLIVPGTSELEIASEISRHMIRHGGIARFVVVTSGERSSRVDAYARHKPIEAGDLVRMDVGCSVHGYFSDMARTVVAGQPTDEQMERYDALLKGEEAQLAMLRPGIQTRELYRVAMDTVRRGALPGYDRNHCGHGIGLSSHEYPMIGPDAETLVEPGMVFCMETPYYEIGWGGMMVEDTAIVTDNGCELLTTSSRALQQ